MASEVVARLAAIYQALGQPLRLELLLAFPAGRPMSASMLVRRMERGGALGAVSVQLQVLRAVGLLACYRPVGSQGALENVYVLTGIGRRAQQMASANLGLFESRVAGAATSASPPVRGARDVQDFEIAELEIPRRLCSTLLQAQIATAGALCRLSSRELLGIPGIGPGSVQDVRAALALHGLTLTD